MEMATHSQNLRVPKAPSQLRSMIGPTFDAVSAGIKSAAHLKVLVCRLFCIFMDFLSQGSEGAFSNRRNESNDMLLSFVFRVAADLHPKVCQSVSKLVWDNRYSFIFFPT